MSIQYINTGSGANAGDGDSLRSAFIKVNNNFARFAVLEDAKIGYTGSQGHTGYTGSTGAYAAIGYTGSAGLLLTVTTTTSFAGVQGQIWFNQVDGRAYIRDNNTWFDLSPSIAPDPSTYLDGLTINGTTISTVDTTASIYVSSDLIPESDNLYDLGSADRQWKSLYVSTNTVYIGGTPLSINADGNLTVDGNPVIGSTRWDATADEPNGCPMFVELNPSHFHAYTQQSHIRLENNGYWDIGSTILGNGVEGYFDGNTTVFSTGTVKIRSGYSPNEWTFGTDGKLTLPEGGAFTSPNYGFSFNKNSGKTGAPELGTDVTFATENLSSDIVDGEVYMGSGYGEFRSIYNKVDSTESGLAYAGVEGFNYANFGDVNFAGMVSQTPNIDSMYTVGLNTLSQITIGFTQNGQTQQSNDWSVVVGSLTTDYTVNGLFADTYKTVISGSQEIRLTTDRGTVLFGNQPECVPTLLTHFHIMKDDPANVDLFLGDDYNYVKLPGNGETAYGVEIGTNVGSAYTWRFGTDGILTLPSGNTRIGDVNGADAIVSNTGTAFGVVTQGTGGYVALEWVDNIENLGTTSTQVAIVVVNSPFASSTGTVQILTGVSTGTDSSNIWEFSANGNLTIPDDIQDANGSVVRVATTSTAPTRVNGQLWFNTDDGRGYIRYDNTWMDLSPTEVPPPSTYLDGLTIDGTTISAIDSTATVSIESGSNMWDFSSTGTLTLPNGSTIGSAEYFSGIPLTTERGTILFGNSPPIGFSSHFHIMKEDPTNVDLFLGDDTNFVKLPTTGGVEITSENTSTWTFGADGFLTFPDSNLQIGELFGLVGMLGGTDAIVGILGQGNSGSVGLEWVDDLTSPTSIAAVLLNNYQSGNVQIQTGIPAGPSASNVWEFGADGRTSFPNYTFQAGDGTAGQVLVTNGSGSVTWTTPIAATGNANTGDFTFTATTLSAATNQSVVLHTNANDWIFGSTGTLTVPGNIIPDVDSIYSLGSPTRKFKDLYVSTTTIYMGDLVISGSPSTGLTINGNSANSKQTFVGGEGVGPDNCSWIEWAIGTNYLTVRNPGTNFKLIMEGLKTGNTFNAVSPIDLTFTVSSTLWHFDNELTPDNPEYRIGVNETNVSFSGEFIYLLAVPVPERTNALSNGIYSLTLDSTGTVTLPGNLILPAGGDIRDTTSNISVLKTRIGDTYASGAFQQLTIAHDEGKLITIAGGNSVFRLPQMTADMLGAEFEFYFSGDAGQIHIQSYYTGVRATTDIFRGSIYVGVDNATTGKLHKATATTATACDLFLGQHHAKVGSYVKVKAIAFNTVGIWMFQGMCVGDTGQTPNSSDHPFQDYN